MKEIYLDLGELALDIDETLHTKTEFTKRTDLILKVITDKFPAAGIPIMTDSYGTYFYANETTLAKVAVNE